MEEPMTTVYVLYPEVRVRVYVDDIKMLICDQNKKLVQQSKGV